MHWCTWPGLQPLCFHSMPTYSQGYPPPLTNKLATGCGCQWVSGGILGKLYVLYMSWKTAFDTHCMRRDAQSELRSEVRFLACSASYLEKVINKSKKTIFSKKHTVSTDWKCRVNILRLTVWGCQSQSELRYSKLITLMLGVLISWWRFRLNPLTSPLSTRVKLWGRFWWIVTMGTSNLGPEETVWRRSAMVLSPLEQKGNLEQVPVCLCISVSLDKVVRTGWISQYLRVLSFQIWVMSHGWSLLHAWRKGMSSFLFTLRLKSNVICCMLCQQQV